MRKSYLLNPHHGEVCRGLLLLLSTFFFTFTYSQEKDYWCGNRISKDNSGSSTELEIVDNPLKESCTNESDKVLRLYNIDQRGTIALNLTRYIGNAADRITDISGYDGLRFKYYINNPPYASSNMRIRMEEGQGDIINATFSHTGKNWQTATFRFPENSQTSWIQISTYYVTIGDWNNAFPGMEIYLDDIELFHSGYITSYHENIIFSGINIKLEGKKLLVSEAPPGSEVSIYDIYGRNTMKKAFMHAELQYTFPEKGIYFLTLKNKATFNTQKILVK